FRPLIPDLLDIYVEGADAGREDAHAPPPADLSKRWVSRSELSEHSESDDEMQEHIGTFLVFKALEIITRKAILGLLDLVITALGIQGNTSPEQFRALDDDFMELAGSMEGNVVYVPACSRTDHAMVTSAVSPDGTWSGPPSKAIADALQLCVTHEH